MAKEAHRISWNKGNIKNSLPPTEERNGLHMELQNAHTANKAGQILAYWEARVQEHVGKAQTYLLEWKGPDGVHTMAVGSSWRGGWLTFSVECYRLVFSAFLREGQFNVHVVDKSCVRFEEVYLETKEQYDKLIKDGFLLFQQVPLVEIDGMKMVQTRAIMSYIAGKYNLYGKDLKERALIDMYVEGISDLMQMILVFPFSPPDAKEKNLESIKERATNRYFPVFEKVLKQHGQDFLVGNKFSWADVQLMEAILAVEEKIPAVLSGFPQLQVFKTKMSNMPTIKKFLQPGSPRKPPPDAHYVETVLKMFKI